MPPISRQCTCLPSSSSCLPINPRTPCFTPPTPIPTTTGFDSPLPWAGHLHQRSPISVVQRTEEHESLRVWLLPLPRGVPPRLPLLVLRRPQPILPHTS